MTRNTAEHFLKRAAANAQVGEELPLPALADELELTQAEMDHLLAFLKRTKWLDDDNALTQDGWAHGRSLLRAHRVYESFLAEQTGLEPTQWHKKADRVEHRIDQDSVNKLANDLKRPRYDPHGDAIPTRRLDMHPLEQGLLLVRIRENGFYRITHTEDEPPEPFNQLIAAGIVPGLIVEVKCLSGGRYQLSWAGKTHRADTAQAAALTVIACEAHETENLPTCSIAELSDGEESLIHSLSPAVRGLERRRLMDLGFVPGSRIRRQSTGAFGGPIIVTVRGTMQAIRTKQAENIFTA